MSICVYLGFTNTAIIKLGIGLNMVYFVNHG
jgi:hypothetical protein